MSKNVKQNVLIIGGAVVAVIVVIVIALAVAGSGPEYTSQLKQDGYPVASQNHLQGGEGVGYAYGCNSQGYGELIVQSKSNLDAQSLAQSVNSIIQQGGLDMAAYTQGDLVSLHGECSDIQEVVQGAGWQ